MLRILLALIILSIVGSLIAFALGWTVCYWSRHQDDAVKIYQYDKKIARDLLSIMIENDVRKFFNDLGWAHKE